jgi:hypothetical protein
MRIFAPTLIGVFLSMAWCASDVACADVMTEGPVEQRRISLFSDPGPSVAYNARSSNYVAPPAPSPTYIDQQARTYCRTYSREVSVSGHSQENYGTACLQPDGTWRIIQ